MTNVRVNTHVQRIVINPANQAISIVRSGPQGPQGPEGPQGVSGAGYIHTQASALTEWTVNHNLGYRPSVQIFSVGGLEMLGEIQHVTDNQTTILFNTAVAGTARLN